MVNIFEYASPLTFGVDVCSQLPRPQCRWCPLGHKADRWTSFTALDCHCRTQGKNFAGCGGQL